MITMTRTEESTAVAPATAPTLLLAFELGERSWKLGFTTGLGQRPRMRQIPARATERVVEEVGRAKARFRLSADAPVASCYEAGREGFWLHRWLVAHGVQNHVIDSSSIEVNRRARRAKTDRLDLGGLLNVLARYSQGDAHAWRVVRVPSLEEEDARQLHRTRETVQQDRNRVINRLKALLLTQGLALPIDAKFLTRLEAARLCDGRPIPAGLHGRLQRNWAQLAFLNRTLAELDAERGALPVNPTSPLGRYVHALPTLRGIGPIGSWTLATEIFGWRQIKNGRELGALVGLVPAPYQSGETAHDQGITRAGHKHVRRLMVQLAWSWVRYQPGSALTRWYQGKFGHGGRRLRRIGIVALARKLLVALWRYVEHGEIPEGAIMTGHAA
jgi:transposase